MSISGGVPSTGVTSFANEACESVDVFATYKSSTLAKAQPDLQDLKAYFSRPRLIRRGTLTLGTRSNVLFDYMINSLFQSAFPQWSNRLSGVYGVRFTINFRFQVAATAFHQGLYALSWQYGDQLGAISTFQRPRAPLSATNVPHVRLDLSENTMVELKIPFLYVNEFYPVTVSTYGIDPFLSYGSFAVNSILPIISVAGMSTPTYELYMFLTDVELYGADNNTTTPIVLQSGVVSEEMRSSHLLSGTLSKVGKISSFIGKTIPSLSAIAGPVSWAADTAAGIARYFGYSRPLLQDPPLKVYRSHYTSETNVDIPMTGFSCGLMQSNTLGVAPEFGATDVDEMSFSYIKRQWSQVCVGAVGTSDTHTKVIYASQITPSVLWFRAPATAPYCNIKFSGANSSATGNSIMPSSVMNLASYFRLWRGGFKFRFTFAKTKFHGGRYMVSYNPSMSFAPIPAIMNNNAEGPEVVSSLVQPYGYSLIMDLKDGNVFEFDIPYVLEAPYLNFESNSGTISVVCIDPLQSNSSVTPTVPFLVEVCGADDFEVADYGGNYFIPKPDGVILQQSGEVVTASKEPAELTIGEKIMSVKQIIQTPWWTLASATASSTTVHTFCPWYTFITWDSIKGSTSPSPAAQKPLASSNVPSFWAKCYVYAKGGTDAHVYLPNATPGSVALVFEQNPQFGSNIMRRDIYYTRRGITGSNPKIVSFGEHPLHIRMPAYQTVVRVLTSVNDTLGYKSFGVGGSLGDGSGGTIFRGHSDQLSIINSSASPQTVWVARSAADDAALAHYIGPVPIYMPNGSPTNNLESEWY